MKTLTQEEFLAKLDFKIASLYAQYQRGIQSSYPTLMDFNQFRMEVFGEEIKLDFNTKPAGCQLVRF